jgi:hypothetical protein
MLNISLLTLISLATLVAEDRDQLLPTCSAELGLGGTRNTHGNGKPRICAGVCTSRRSVLVHGNGATTDAAQGIDTRPDFCVYDMPY